MPTESRETAGRRANPARSESHPPVWPRRRHRIDSRGGFSRAGALELLESWDLFVLLVRREIQVRYRQTALGIVWVILQPLLPAIVIAFVFGTFARLPSGETPYLLLALSGLVAYGLFAGVVTRAGASLVRDTQLVSRVYIPRVLLPLAAGAAALVDFLIGWALLVVVMLLLGEAPPLTALAAPLVGAWIAVIAMGLGLALAGLTAHYRDFSHVVPFILQFVLYASPVVYAIDLVPSRFQLAYSANPLVAPVGVFRWAVLGSTPPAFDHVLVGSVAGISVVTLGVLVFVRATRNVADVI